MNIMKSETGMDKGSSPDLSLYHNISVNRAVASGKLVFVHVLHDVPFNTGQRVFATTDWPGRVEVVTINLS